MEEVCTAVQDFVLQTYLTKYYRSQLTATCAVVVSTQAITRPEEGFFSRLGLRTRFRSDVTHHLSRPVSSAQLSAYLFCRSSRVLVPFSFFFLFFVCVFYLSLVYQHSIPPNLSLRSLGPYFLTPLYKLHSMLLTSLSLSFFSVHVGSKVDCRPGIWTVKGYIQSILFPSSSFPSFLSFLLLFFLQYS